MLTITPARLLLIIAVILFIMAALLAGGVVTGSGLAWLLPGGLAAFAMSFLA